MTQTEGLPHTTDDTFCENVSAHRAQNLNTKRGKKSGESALRKIVQELSFSEFISRVVKIENQTNLYLVSC
jgi:hypothetical protein